MERHDIDDIDAHRLTRWYAPGFLKSTCDARLYAMWPPGGLICAWSRVFAVNAYEDLCVLPRSQARVRLTSL